MSDGTTALLFGKLFKEFASDPTEQHKQWARDLWGHRGEFDFSPYQMDADDALVVLGLARRGVHPRYPKDGEVYLYEGDDE